MNRDLDTLLRDADPLRNAPVDDTALLASLRERVDRERTAVPVRRRPHWRRRITLVAAAAAVLTAVPLGISTVLDDDAGPALLPSAVAAGGQFVCGEGYAAAVDPARASDRLLPADLPAGWSYSQIFAREEATTGTCIPPSLTALRTDVDGRVTGRISVTGPVDARVDQRRLIDGSVADTFLGHEARRFELQPHDVVFHRWFWTDEQGQRWSVEASGMPLDEARQTLSAVSIDGPDVAWDAADAPGWTPVHLREGPPYAIAGVLSWYVEITDGGSRRTLMVDVSRGPAVPLLANTGVGERLTTVDGHPAVLGIRRGGELPVLVEIEPGTVAYTFATTEDLFDVQRMLSSLEPVPGDDPRLERYGTD